jgi:DNA-binding transcriptional LysR family regulator
MDTRWIQDFVTLAEVRNFTRAAEIRNVSQAAFSRRIQSLEHWLGASLIDRTTYPLKLTAEGERFRASAIALVEQIAEARSGISGEPSRDHVRIAMPYALATTRFPGWWRRWSHESAVTCSVVVGNVHDTVSSFTAGSVDLLVCYHHAAHPIQLDAGRYERHEIAVEKVRPYASTAFRDAGRAALPGTAVQPIPLLLYSSTVYFARLVDTAIESASQRLAGWRAAEAEMSDVLGDLAMQGLGVAWLPDSSLCGDRLRGLVPLGDGEWDLDVSIVAYRSRAGARRAATQVWDRIVRHADA